MEKGNSKYPELFVTYGLMTVALFLALADRRTGTEYILIALGCCSVVVYTRPASIVASFAFAFICYFTYVWVDVSLPFIPDPSIPYLLAQNSLMFLSAVAVVAQSFAFRALVSKYSNSLRQANREIYAINEELKSSNEELQAFLENMDMLVRQKSAQLQAYVDAIDTTICAVTLDLEGNFISVNRPFAQLSGYIETELSGLHYSILNTDQFTSEFQTERDNLLLRCKSWSGELKYKRKDGTFFWIDCVVMPLTNEAGAIKEFLSLGIPITERKLADELKAKTQNLLESIAFKTSHKIRSPLATIEGLTNLLKQRLISEQEYDTVASKLAISSEDLKEATSELVRFVNSQQKTFQANELSG